MRPYYIALLLFLTGCPNISPPDINEQQYGTLYFTMECVWRNHNDGETLWWCSQDVETELLTGHLALELLEDDRLAFCGEDLVLNSGHELHDNLVSLLTKNIFNCIYTPENELGNEFDWLWYKEDKTLQIIWRPEDSNHKQLTLIIDPGRPVTDVRGRVYYLEYQ
tara:strand:- start:1881 stop:2375 length:495 start_codon:yes stop_codon:yes gene_type:complete